MRSVLGVLALLLGVAAAVEFVVLAQAALTLIAIALFLSLALNPGVAFFQRRGLGRATAVGAVSVLALLAFALLGLVFVPPLIDQGTKFIDALPSLVADLTEGHGKLGFLERDYHVVERVREATSGKGPAIEGAAAPVLSVAKGVATTVIGVVIIAFLTLFMLLEGPDWRRRVEELVPERSRASVERIGAGVYKGVSGFVIGNLLASFLAGVFVTILFLVVGVPYAIPVGLFVALIELVPYLGPVVATLVVTGVALTEGVAPGLVVLALIGVYHLAEGHTLRPLIYGRALKLSPLAVLIAILLGIEVAGILGALVSVPH
jgi:predicted PurR-regulated permease PerM